MQQTLIDEYVSMLPTFQALELELRSMFTQLLADLPGGGHTVSHRIKSRDSLIGKLARPDRTYQQLSDITDLVGVRVVTYYEDSIQDVAKRVEQVFSVDLARSVDKRRQIELDRFGYRSLHYICSPPPEFFAKHGLQPVPNLKFEVQLRTILQHAWAEMEHDLGYKASEAIPAHIRRRFSRLAGLLELADEEFLNIKNYLHQYERQVAESIQQKPDDLRLDRVSLTAFIDHPRVRAADTLVAQTLRQIRAPEPFYPDYLAQMLSLVGLDHVAGLESALAWAEPRLEEFVPRYFSFSERAWGLSAHEVGPVKKGYSLLFVAHMRLLSSSHLDVELVEEVTRFFHALDYPDDRDTARSLAARLIEAAR